MMIPTITSSLELEELLKEHQNLLLFVSGNQCSLLPLNLQSLVDIVEGSTVIYQADIFQVPKLISIYRIQPSLPTLLVFKEGELVAKKEV